MERSVRSNHYQHEFFEVPVSYEFLSVFNTSQSMESCLNPFKYDEEIFDLKDRLVEIIYATAEIELTDSQKIYFKEYYINNEIQKDIAKKNNVNQSTVVKSLHGNVIYGGKYNHTRYGGSIKKLREILLNNQEVKDILEKIAELQEQL